MEFETKTIDVDKTKKVSLYLKITLAVMTLTISLLMVTGKLVWHTTSKNPIPTGVSISDSTRIAGDAIVNYKDSCTLAEEKERREANQRFADNFNTTIKDVDYTSFPLAKASKLDYPEIRSRWTTLDMFNLHYMRNAVNSDAADSIRKEIENNSEGFLNFLEGNKTIIKGAINFAGKNEALKGLYDKIAVWTTSDKDKKTSKIKTEFDKFFKKYGDLEKFPQRSDIETDKTAKSFWKDMDRIAKIDPKAFESVDYEVSDIYKEYLFSQRWQKKVGKSIYKKIVKVIHEILN